jgi:hypothetical protein
VPWRADWSVPVVSGEVVSGVAEVYTRPPSTVRNWVFLAAGPSVAAANTAQAPTNAHHITGRFTIPTFHRNGAGGATRPSRGLR